MKSDTPVFKRNDKKCLKDTEHRSLREEGGWGVVCIFDGQVFYRSQVLQNIRLRSFAV